MGGQTPAIQRQGKGPDMSKETESPTLKGALPEVKADPVARGILAKHGRVERNATLLLVLSLLVVTVGGIVEIAPLFYLENTIEKVEGMRPYSPLELAGRNIYIREGCYICHSQMIRPFRDEVERYGHYCLAAESMYDHPFQWGSKRTGPDLARVGGRYSDEWHVQHLIDPRSVVPESVMPSYGFLATTDLDMRDPAGHLAANRAVGVPYSDEMVENARADLMAQATAERRHVRPPRPLPKGGRRRLSTATTQRLTEMDALDRLPADARHARRLLRLRAGTQRPLGGSGWISTTTAMRAFADSWGLLAMILFFLGVLAWVFRPGAPSRAADDAASIPFKED